MNSYRLLATNTRNRSVNLAASKAFYLLEFTRLWSLSTFRETYLALTQSAFVSKLISQFHLLH